MGEKSQIK